MTGTPHYANVADLADIDRVGRMIVSSWIDRDEMRDIESGRVDGIYVRLVGDDGEQVEARAEILSEQFGVRTATRREPIGSE